MNFPVSIQQKRVYKTVHSYSKNEFYYGTGKRNCRVSRRVYRCGSPLIAPTKYYAAQRGLYRQRCPCG
ncbi:putative lipase [Escherichia coli str. 'clone D i14']|nr:putative lipase [Escherichia coli str. 'clone D i2']AER91869.1 putative lipase [Escherichia coli str. 'clone D i14']